MSPGFTGIGLPHELLSSFIALPGPGGKKQVLLGPGLRYPTGGAILLFLSQDVIIPWVNAVPIWKVRNRGANNKLLIRLGKKLNLFPSAPSVTRLPQLVKQLIPQV